MKELEKKYLAALILNSDSLLLSNFSSSEITQFYISENPEIRIRLTNDIILDSNKVLCCKGNKASITIKTKEQIIEGGLDREETIIKITCKKFEELVKITIPNSKIKKHRYYIPYGNYLIEYDLFGNRHDGLILAEVEFKSQEHMKEFVPPEWFLIDVTDDPTFLNRNLALNGMPTKRILELMSKKIMST